MVWINHQFVLGSSYGRTELERAMDLAIEVPDTTYRSANKVQRAFRKSWGAAREPERPGSKPGRARQPTNGWRDYEQYVTQRRLQSRVHLIPRMELSEHLLGYPQARLIPTYIWHFLFWSSAILGQTP